MQIPIIKIRQLWERISFIMEIISILVSWHISIATVCWDIWNRLHREIIPISMNQLKSFLLSCNAKMIIFYDLLFW